MMRTAALACVLLAISACVVAIKDPHKVFCGRQDCYDVLGVKSDAAQSAIRKKFRDLSLTLHPDKGGDAQGFLKYQRAYDILSDPEKREHYDACADDQDLYWEEYGHYYGTRYAPKSDITFVVIGIVLIAAVAHLAHLKSAYKQSRDLFKDAALAGTPINQGGSQDSLDVHNAVKATMAGTGAKKGKKKERKGDYSLEYEAAVEQAITQLEKSTGQGSPGFKDTFLFSLPRAMMERFGGSKKAAPAEEGKTAPEPKKAK